MEAFPLNPRLKLYWSNIMATTVLTEEVDKCLQRYLRAVEAKERTFIEDSRAATELRNSTNELGKSLAPADMQIDEVITLPIGGKFLCVRKEAENTYFTHYRK